MIARFVSFPYNIGMKNKFFLFLFSFFALLLGSCSSSSTEESIPVYTGEDHRVTMVFEESFLTEYNSGDDFPFDKIQVFYDDVELSKEEYFFTLNQEDPYSYQIGEDAVFTSSARESNITFYAAYLTTIEENQVYVVSEGKEVLVINMDAVSPVLYYVGSAILLVALGVWCFIRAKKR